jgi:hypothetical protein
MCRILLKPRSLAILILDVALLAAADLSVWAVARAQGPDPNPQPITVVFTSSSYTVGEGDGSVTITVTLRRPAGLNLPAVGVW